MELHLLSIKHATFVMEAEEEFVKHAMEWEKHLALHVMVAVKCMNTN